MAWTFVAAGTGFARAGPATGVTPTNITVQLPAGVATGDLILLQIQVNGNNASAPTPVNPTGWTQLALITNGGTSNHRHYYGYIRREATTANPVISFTGIGNTNDSYSARTFAYRPGAGYDWLVDVIGTPSTNANALPIGPATGITPTTLANPLSTLIVGSFGKPNDISLSNVITTPVAGLVPVGFTNGVAHMMETQLGLDSSVVHIHSLNWTSGATGNLTVPDSGGTLANFGGLGASILVSFKEDPLTVSGIALRSFATIC